MAAITKSRLEEIRRLASTVTPGATRESESQVLERLARLAAGINDVNAALAQVNELLISALYDEAISIHDADLVSVARVLNMRSRPSWIHLHAWILERGQATPPPVNIEVAEQFAAVLAGAGPSREDLVTLRRLVLARAPLADRLAVLRRLREADPTSLAWAETLDEHEEARLRENRMAIPACTRSCDVESLAAIADEVASSTWGRPPPAELLAALAGAREAGQLAKAAEEAKSLAEETTAILSQGGALDARDIDGLAARRSRLLELSETAHHLVAALAAYPDMLELVRARNLDTAIRRRSEELAASLDAIEKMAAKLRTKREFEGACSRVDYLCDHPPEKGQESHWLADFQRQNLVIRVACQEFPDLTLPSLLHDRAQSAASAVEAREYLRKRFWAITSIASVVSLIVITAGVGWGTWKRSEYLGAVATLGRRVAEARMGAHLGPTPDIGQIIAQYPSASELAALSNDFDAAVAAEKKRALAFKNKLVAHGEFLEELSVAAGERRADGEQSWLDPWPKSYVEATAALRDTRRLGGLPANRGDPVGDGPLAPAARQRFQDEEDELARAEARQANLDRALERLAGEAFDKRIGRLQDRLNGDLTQDQALELQAEARQLKALATAPKADGLPTESAHPRVPQEALGTLNAIDTRLRVIGREGTDK